MTVPTAGTGWEAARRPELLASAEGRAARYHEVRGRTLREPITEAHYPPELRWVCAQVRPSRGVPRFILAMDGFVVLNVLGTEAYRDQFLPALRAAVASRSRGNMADANAAATRRPLKRRASS
jgi:hypothetical protein